MHTLTGHNLPLPARKKDSHKGDYGHVLLIGGGEGMLGAIAMAALSALRAGAGMVSIACSPAHASGVLLSLVPEAMVYCVNSEDELLPLLTRATFIVIGPGLGNSDWAKALFSCTINSKLPMVVDASALGLLAAYPRKKDNWVLTPHPGEAAHLLGTTTAHIQQNRIQALSDIQKKYGGVVVLKGANSLIHNVEGEIFICPRGNPGMSTAGMGDILTGLIAGLGAQGLSLSEAATTAVWVHATAADHLAQVQGEAGLLAHDLIPLFPLILNGFMS